MHKTLLAIACLCFSYSVSFSQQTAIQTHALKTYYKAIDLYESQQYIAAQGLFSKVKETSTDKIIQGDCSYYIANCAIRLNQQDADYLMEQFVNTYPTSIKRNDAFLDVGNYYFENGKYPYARKWYDKVDPSTMSVNSRDRFYFNNGYAYFVNKRYKEAESYFNKLVNTNTYGAQAKYYLGYMAYEGDDYDTASKQFENLKGDSRYAEDLSYYEADMNFKLGNFQKAIDLALEKYETSDPKEKSELSKIIGESYFNLENYAEAIPYLKQYRGKRGQWNNTDYYQLGYAYYKQQQYPEAISEFNRIIGGKDPVSQNAYYHLAESYLKQDQKQQALNAFKNASEMSFSPQIQEDASLNYAKLSYEIGNSYESVPQVLLTFIKNYPKNPNIELLETLLIDSYLTSKNYGAALELLESNRSFENKQVYQKVAFLRGLEVMNEGDFAIATDYFNKSLKQPYDPIYTARATFWLAESEYQKSNFETSLVGYKQFLQLPKANETPEYKNIYYNLGYNQFKLKSYTAAIESFEGFLASSTSNAARQQDAYLRLGDSHFISSSYWPAMENYNKAIDAKSPNADYAAFQKAISYGFVDRNAKKMEALSQFGSQYPKSFYKDDALYELGNTYLSQDDTAKAMKAYEELVQGFSGSSYVPKALLKQALLLDNSGSSNGALSKFKEVANRFPSTPEAIQAVSSAKLIYIDQGKVNEYANWVQTLDFISVENSELDDASYAAAEQPYLENKNSLAKSRFQTYLSDFPNGAHALKANFYLAQLLFAEDTPQEAIPYYEYVVSKDRNEFTEQALARISELLLAQKDYAKALPYLEQLEAAADFPQNVMFAQTNSMKAHFELDHYESAVIYAEKVLSNPKVEPNVQADANVIIARSAIKTGNSQKAKEAYVNVAQTATGRLAAEALYYDAFFKNQEGLFEASNEQVQKLAKEYSGYPLFGSKGLVLMAQNFYALEDAFQATYILESVIENFTQFPEVVEEAKAELARIKSLESKTNSSVETEDKQ